MNTPTGRHLELSLNAWRNYAKTDAEVAEAAQFERALLAADRRLSTEGGDPGLAGVAFATSAKLPTPGAEVYPTQLVRAPDGGMYLLLSSGEMLDADGLGLAEDEHELRMRVWGAIKARRQSEGGK